jgi:hypothetical protein
MRIACPGRGSRSQLDFSASDLFDQVGHEQPGSERRNDQDRQGETHTHLLGSWVQPTCRGPDELRGGCVIVWARRSTLGTTSHAPPDLDADILVHHVRETDPSGHGTRDRWLVFVGRTKRSDTEDERGALVFARLLADLIKRPVWMRHDPDGPLAPIDTGAIRGCSCC